MLIVLKPIWEPSEEQRAGFKESVIYQECVFCPSPHHLLFLTYVGIVFILLYCGPRQNTFLLHLLAAFDVVK